MKAAITYSPPTWTNSAGMLSTPVDFPFFNDCTATSSSQRRMGWSSTSLPVTGEIAGVNTASLGGYLHSTKTKARWAEGYHDELNGHVFDLERDGLRQVVLCPRPPCDDNTQPYHTGSVAARVNKDRAFAVHPDGCVKYASGTLSKVLRKRHHHRHLEHNDTKSCWETSGTNTRNGQVQIEHPWTLW